MLDRLTEHARRVVVLSQQEARELQHGYVGTEHLLLGMLREGEGLGARVLASLGITADPVRAEIISIVGPGEAPRPDPLPFTQRAKEIIVLAVEHARSQGDDYVGTEHMLFGLALEPERTECVSAMILKDLGTDLATMLRATRQLRHDCVGPD